MTGTLYKSAPVWLASLMMIASHLEVGFVFCWVIVAETLEYQNAFIKILSQPVFTRYAKITYAMYLFTPIVTIIICGLLRTEGNYNVPEIVSIKSYEVMILNCKILLSQIIISYVILKITGRISFLATAYFEVPFCNFSRCVLPKKKSSSSTQKTK